MKKICLWVLLCTSSIAFAQTSLTYDFPFFGYYEYQKGIFSNGTAREVSKGGFGLGFDIFNEKSVIGFYFRGFFEFPFSLEYKDNLSNKKYNNFTTAWGMRLLIGPSFKLEPTKYVTINIAPAVGFGFSDIYIADFSNFYDIFALKSAVFDVPIAVDISVKIRPHKNFFVTAGVLSQYSLLKIPIDSNTVSGWNNKNLSQMFAFTPYIGLGFTLKETYLVKIE